MWKNYWTLFFLGWCGSSFLVLVVLGAFVLTYKGLLSKKYFIVSFLISLLAIIVCIYALIIPCMKDYPMAREGEYIEVDAVVIEFTDVWQDLDGTGEIYYTKPKFYIESTDEYVVLNAADVKVGKTYRIRYLPNTKICEVLYEIEEQ